MKYLLLVWVMVTPWAARGEQAGGAGSPLRVLWAEADHASGVYYAKDKATVNVMIENPSGEAQALEGLIEFGMAGETTGNFKALSVTPIAETTLGGHQRAKIPLNVTFGAAGLYELRWVQGDKSFITIENAAGVMLQAIFPPRVGRPEDSQWITTLPRQAAQSPGYLPDLVGQTSVQRYLLDERFAFDATTNIGLGLGASLGITVEQTEALFGDLAKAKAALVVRVTVPVGRMPDAKAVAGFKQYLADGMKRSRGALKGLVISPDLAAGVAVTVEQRAAYRAFYFAGYEVAKKQDKNIVMLGAGTAQCTRDLLVGTGREGKGEDFAVYLDGVAITDAVSQPALALQVVGARKIAVWVLPPMGADPWALVPAAAALAEGAAVAPVPPPAVDRGVTAHLLGGAVRFERVHPERLPFVAVFQGNDYAVAAVAGLSANTPADALYPALARTRTTVNSTAADDGRPPYPNLEVSDDTQSLRVVDAAGAPVDCRVGDTLYVPAADHIVYVLQAGEAEELVGLLRPAVGHRLPMVDVGAVAAMVGDGGAKKPAINLRLENITATEVGGIVRIIAPPAGDQKAVTLAENTVVPISAGKHVEMILPLSGEVPSGPIIVELTTERGVQRTAIVVGR